MQPSLQATDNPLQLLEPRTPLIRHLVPLALRATLEKYS